MTKKHIDKARTASDHKSKERVKKTGEIFTPVELINEMLDQLPEDLWQPGKTVLEPAAGDGNFVVEVLKRKLSAGCTPTQAIQDVYAVEFARVVEEYYLKEMAHIRSLTIEEQLERFFRNESYKVKMGLVYTPLKLVDEMMENL